LEERIKLFLAPLAGITDKSFRRLCRECGAALVYTEMVSAKALWYEDKKTEKLLDTCLEEAPVGFQIFGSEPDIMAFAAKTLAGRENAVLDVNMGCPVPKIVKNGDGSALMKNPDKAGMIIEAMCKVTKKPVTVKIRSGWDADSVNAVEFAKVLESAGAAMICVHARTRDQHYSGKADWNVIARVKAAVRIPVIGNGDVLSVDDAVKMTEQTGCDYVMVGRGALGNPWIFGKASGGDAPSARERADMFLRHARLTAEDKGEHIAVLEMRKHAGWYFKGMAGAAKLRSSVNKISTMDVLVSEIEEFIQVR
jgi:tRNA-dihydrouridine synthase B